MKTIILRTIFSVLFLCVLLFIAVKTVNIPELISLLQGVSMNHLITLCAISFTISLIKSWRFFILLKNNNIPISFWKNVTTFIAGHAATPLPAGEAVRGILLHKATGIRLFKTSSPIVTQAYLDLSSAAFLAFLGSLYYDVLVVPIFIIFALIAATTVVLIYKPLLEKMLSSLPDKNIFNTFSSRMKNMQKGVRSNLIQKEKMRPNKIMVETFAMALITNILGGVLIKLSAQPFNVDIDIFRSIFIYSSSVVIQGLTTVLPGGLGFTEGAMTGIFVLSKVELSKAIAITVLFRSVTLIFSILIGLIFFLIFHSKFFLKHKK